MTTTTDALTRSQAAQRMQEIHERLTELSGKWRTSKADEQEFTEITAELDELHRHVERLDRRDSLDAIAGAARGNGGSLRTESGTPDWDPFAGRDAAEARAFGGVRDSALRQLEKSVKGGLPAAGAEVVERLVEAGPEHERSWAARWVRDTGAEAYKAAFAKLVAFGERREPGWSGRRPSVMPSTGW
jgi:hypothetical protein